MILKDIMTSSVRTVSLNATVQETVEKMSKFNIGAIVVGSTENIEGIFSERDLLKKVIAKDLNPETTLVKEVMTTDVLTINSSDNLQKALKVMKINNFRHLPVVDKYGYCVGLVGIRDLIKNLTDNLKKQNKALEIFVENEKF